jgi:hypothetical protein
MLLFTRHLLGVVLVATAVVIPTSRIVASEDLEDGSPLAVSAAESAAKVDELIDEGLRNAGIAVAPRASDEDFLRRVSFDLAGRLPTPEQVRKFTADSNPNKRIVTVAALLGSEAYARNWARYWRDVVLSRATNQRVGLVQARFESWLTEQFAANTPWDEVATQLLTATGDVREEGSTALVFAHDGDAAEIAAETSRIFLGIQISCANCHDHPYDSWKREDFHTLAAYFPRVRVRPVREENQIRSFEVVSFNVPARAMPSRGTFDLASAASQLVARYDRSRDGELSAAEVAGSPLARQFERLVARIDADGNGMLSVRELRTAQPPMNASPRMQSEYLMPDLADPGRPGDRMDPAFFVSGEAAARELTDEDRRLVLAQQITETTNPWFARAYVNRVWAELLGEGFYTPVDDLGPQRSPRFPEALEVLAEGFTASGYDPRWLFRTIALTEAYQRAVRAPSADQPLPFASALPTRLRSDQIYDALEQVVGSNSGPSAFAAQRGRFAFGGPRGQFAQLFGHDPSDPKEDLLGTVPQALFLMNSELVNEAIRTNAATRLNALLYRIQDDERAIAEVYLIVLARRPTARETAIVLDHLETHGHRGESFEDLMWSLLNSTEFVTRR